MAHQQAAAAAPAASSSASSHDGDDGAVRTAPAPGYVVDFMVPVLDRRVHFVLPPIPYQTEALQAADWLDTKIPTIRGRPAIRECLANLRPGVTVALVSLPLSISLAIAADALPVQGCITAVWAGIISAVMGGSHYNIVGPTGALSGILSYYSLKYCPGGGAPCYTGILSLLAILSGLLSLLVWSSGMDRFLVFIPGAVMHGFTLGVAFIITANQLNFLLGLPKLQRHPEFLANMAETFTHLQMSSPLAICFFVVTFYMLFNLVKRYGKVPWAVLLAVAGIILGMALEKTQLRLQTIRTRYGDLSIQLIQWLDQATLPALTVETISDVMRGSVSICAVAVLETLISARIADRMTKTIFDQPAEVLSVGLANLGSGLFGGIPATAALARTALNCKSGATSRGSGIVSAITIALLCSVLFSSFKYLPLPVVATILVNTAYRMVEWHEIKTLIETDMPMMVVCVVTAVICAVQDPTMGIVYGSGFAMIRILLTLMHGHSHLRIYQGARIDLSVEFKLNNGAEAVAEVRRKYLRERDLGEVARERARLAKAEAVASSTNAIAAAASALRVAEEDARATTMALSAAASGRSTAKKLPPSAAAAAAVAAATAAAQGGEGGEEEEEEPAFLKGVDPVPGDERLPKVAVYGLPGYATYVGAKSHVDRVRGLFVEAATCIPGIDVIAFDASEVKYADPDALEAIGDVVDEMGRASKTVFILGAAPYLRRIISHLHWSHQIVHFEDYQGLLTNMREALKLDDERLAGGGGDAAVLSLAEMVVNRVRELTTAAFTAVPIVVSGSSGGSSGSPAASSSSAAFKTPSAAARSSEAAAPAEAPAAAAAGGANAGPPKSLPVAGGALTVDSW